LIQKGKKANRIRRNGAYTAVRGIEEEDNSYEDSPFRKIKNKKNDLNKLISPWE
jgi:hypothetical protein